MSIQDLIITVVACMFILCVIPTIRGPQKPPISTSLTLALGLSVISTVYATLGLWLGALTTVTQGALWAVLVVQRLRQNERKYYIGMDGRRHDQLIH